jgi:DNA-binding response OmpR family regulator
MITNTPPLKVLVVDDDAMIRKLVVSNLAKRSYRTREASNGQQAQAMIREETPDLFIIDLVMPNMSGVELCTWIRMQGHETPIIVLSAYDQEDMKVQALDAGADDYVTKPFKVEEFLARMRALVRRATVADTNSHKISIENDGVVIDTKARRMFVDGTDLHLTRTEFALCETLGKNADNILTHDELLARVWGEEYRGSSHYLHVYLGRIRKKMGIKYENLLETVPGIGYIFHSKLPETGAA